MIKIEIHCVACGRVFEPKTPLQITCSSDCSADRKRAMSLMAHRERKQKQGSHTPRVCEICGLRFIPAHGSQKYCSAECREEASREYRKRSSRVMDDDHIFESNPWETEFPKIRNCAYCGKPFETTHRFRRYCSDRCRINQSEEVRKRSKEIAAEINAPEDPVSAAAADAVEKEVAANKKAKAESKKEQARMLEEMQKRYEGRYVPEEHPHEPPSAYAERQKAESVEKFATLEIPEWVREKQNGKRNEGKGEKEKPSENNSYAGGCGAQQE